MTVQELTARFPEIPADLHGEPELAELAEAFDGPLRMASKPSACASDHDAGNVFYLKLVGPMDIYRYGLYTRERALGEIRKLLSGFRADPEGFAQRLLPETVAEKGPERR